MTDPVIHPATHQTLSSMQLNPPQSLLFSGPRGIGLYTIARWFASAHLAGELKPQDTKEQIDSQNGTISVEMIRGLYDQTRAKHTSRQVIIIDDADRMSRGAQSAFLKLLEEPNSHIYFLLTSHQPQNLLPTIRSRAQHTAIPPLGSTHSTKFIASLGALEPVKQAQLQFIAEGLPAELVRLTGNEAYFKERAEIIGDARDFLQADTYEKLLIIQKYRQDRSRVLQLIDSILYILRRSASAKPQQQLIVQLERLLSVRERISANHNIQLQLSQFVV